MTDDDKDKKDEKLDVSERVRRSLEELLIKSSKRKDGLRRRGPNPMKTSMLYEQMPMVHQVLESATIKEVLEYLEKAGSPVSRETLRNIYRRWALDNNKKPNIAAPRKAKKTSAQSQSVGINSSVREKIFEKINREKPSKPDNMS